MHPWWVQIALKPTTDPAVGRANSTGPCFAVAAMDPRTGMADTFANAFAGGFGGGGGGVDEDGGRLFVTGGRAVVECVCVGA